MDDKLLRYSRALSVAYVYEEESDKTQYYDSVFKDVKYVQYNQFLKDDEIDVDIVFVNFSSKDIKPLFNKLSSFGAVKVIFTPYESHAGFLKNALKFKIDIVTKKTTDQTVLEPLFQSLVKNITTQYKKSSELKRYESIVGAKIHGYIIVNDKALIYVSDKIKEDFNVANFNEFVQNYYEAKQNQFQVLFDAKVEQKYVELTSMDEQKHSYIATVKKIQSGLLLCLTPTKIVQEQKCNNTLSRIVFIEELKNSIVHNDRNQLCLINLVMVKITNYETILKDFGNYTAYQFVNEFANYLKEFIDSDALVASWGIDGFVVMSEKLCHEDLKQSIESLTDQVTYKVFENSVVPFIKAAMMEVKDDDLNEVITTLDSFFKASVALELAKKYAYHEVCQIQKNMDQEETLFYYFSNMMYAQTSLKLLNIYKGVHISTTAHIEKIDPHGQKIFVKAKNIQLYTMQIEKKTVIQSSSLPKDVEVGVDVVDLKKNIAIFSTPKLLEFSANNRETTRVQSDFRFPVKVKQGKMIHSGEILDLSIRSLAVKFPVMIQNQFEKGEVFVSFRVPVETHDDGFFQTQIKGKLIKFDELDHKFCKAVILLEMEEPDEGYVLEYIHKRQKEIIFGIKKLALKGLSNGF